MKNIVNSKNISILDENVVVGNKTIPNRIAIQPMEGCDGERDGTPSETVYNRYEKFGASGAGLIWAEAVAVNNEGRANPRQLYLTDKNIDSFKKLVLSTKETCYKKYGFEPFVILQATHSGRYSKPNGKPEPIIAYNNPIFEKDSPIDKSRIATDDYLKSVEEDYERTAKLTEKSGFDGMDVKACHRYLNSELLSAYTREGEYGGSFENRTRFFKNAVDISRNAVSNDFIITSRMNIYDGFPYPYGFGVAEGKDIEPVLDEPIELIKQLNFDIINITMGNPYFNPEVNRPVELEAVDRIYGLTKEIKTAFPNMTIVSSGPTYMREKSGSFAAGAVENGYCDIVGFGRMAFAYTEFAADIIADKFDRKKTCITCGKCTELMRGGHIIGCVIRDKKYAMLYKEMIKNG